MKRIFSHPFVALAAGLCLRLFFVFKFPANSGDTVLYEQMAANWLQHHVYAMEVFGRITPVDLRMPGYPAFLAVVYAVTGKTGVGAHLVVMLAQAVVDLGKSPRQRTKSRVEFDIRQALAIREKALVCPNASPSLSSWATS